MSIAKRVSPEKLRRHKIKALKRFRSKVKYDPVITTGGPPPPDRPKMIRMLDRMIDDLKTTANPEPPTPKDKA